MTLYMPTYIGAVTGDPAINYTAQDDRNLIGAVVPNQGTVLSGDLQVGPRAAGANLSVDVAAGRAFIQGGSIARQGTYLVPSDATVNVGIQAPDATNPRVDGVFAQVYDKQADGGTRYGWQPIAVAGTPAASPVAPATPVSSLLLATVYVPANATSIVANGTNAAGGTGSITDQRVLSGRGEVPKWDFSGTQATAQAITSGAAAASYTPFIYFQTIGVIADGTRARVRILTPGRYNVHLGLRLGPSTNVGERTSLITLYTADGATVLREIAQGTRSPDPTPVTASGTLYCRRGEILDATIFQATGQTISIDDSHKTTNFTGVWVGA